MSRQTRFPALDHEPKAINGPPPAYRSGSATVTEIDAWSQYSDSSGLGRRRNSWTNLVESDENLNKHKVNCYPKVHAPFQNQALSGTMISTIHHPLQPQPASRTASSIGMVTEGYYQGKGSLPVFADPSGVPPAGSIQFSRPPSKSPSMAQIIDQPTSDLPKQTKRNRLQECKNWCARPLHAFCLIFLLIALLIGAILAIVLTQVLIPPKNISMSWLPPEMMRSGQSSPTKIQMNAEGAQVRMQLQGAPPFKGNYISYYDFKANRVIVIDESLKTSGKNSACFVFPLDRSNLPSELDMRKAANSARKKKSQTQGWGEQWTWISSPLLSPPVIEPAIPECEGVRWIQLDYISTNQQNRKCTDCHDFCLPDYGIEKDQLRDENYLNILRRNCFYLFVPEWRAYAQQNSLEQNQRDFEQYYRNRNHITTSYGGPNIDPKWIPLAVPQNVINNTRQIASGVVNSVTGAVDQIKQNVFGGHDQNNMYGQQNGQHGQNMNVNGNNGVSGVVNLHGVNGNSGVNMYNMGNQQQQQQQQQIQQQLQQQQQHQQMQQVQQQLNAQHTSPESYRTYTNGYTNSNSNPNGLQNIPNGINTNANTGNLNNDNANYMSGFGANPNFRITSQNTKIESVSTGYVPDVATNTNQQSGYQDNGNNRYNNNGYNQNGYGSTNSNGYSKPVISSSYSIATGENGRPQYPDQNGINPPAGYIPQVAQQTGQQIQQGVAGMALPPNMIDTSGRHTGYTPDIIQQQPQPSGGRWIAAG